MSAQSVLPWGVLVAILTTAVAFRPPVGLALAAGYAAMSVVTFAVYAADKAAARRGRLRTRESTLHLLELLGGWPGALAAQRLLRHKTIKVSFQTTFRICMGANLAGLLLAVLLARVLG